MPRPAGSVQELRRETPERCDQCQHPFGPHKVFILGETVMDGGVFVCNVSGCPCTATWGIRGTEKPKLPDEETLQRLRAHAQGEHHWDEP